LVCLLLALAWLPTLRYIEGAPSQASRSCSQSCGAQDPVNDPDYNIRESIKQTLLLEQHLAEKSKYCKACCVKHMLLIESMLSEAVWMACDHCGDYKNLEESVDFFKELFKQWHSNMDDDTTRLSTLSKLRDWRREMVEIYYFTPTDIAEQ
jgi:hypothetical protein